MADSTLLAHVLIATMAWLCERMFPRCRWFALPEEDTVTACNHSLSLIQPLNEALQRWLIDRTPDSVSRKNPTELRLANATSARRAKYEIVEVKARIILDMGARGNPHLQHFMDNIEQESLQHDELQILPGAGALLWTKVLVQEGAFEHLTKLLWRCIDVDETSTLQVESWGIFFKCGESLRLLKFEQAHRIPQIHEVSYINDRMVSIKGQHLRGSEITAVTAGNKATPLEVFWPGTERARESEVLVATLPEDGLDRSNSLTMFAAKTISQDGYSLVVRSQGTSLQPQQPIHSLAITGFLAWMSTPCAWIFLMLALLVEASRSPNNGAMKENIPSVPIVWTVTWFLVQLLPASKIRSIKAYFSKKENDSAHSALPFNGVGRAAPPSPDREGASPMYIEHAPDAQEERATDANVQSSMPTEEEKNAGQSDMDIDNTVRDDTNNTEDSSTPHTSPQRDSSDVTIDGCVQQWAATPSEREEDTSPNRDSFPDQQDAPLEAQRLLTSGEGATHHSRSYSSSQRLENCWEEPSFPRLEEEDMLKFFPEKLKTEDAGAGAPPAHKGTARTPSSASAGSSPSRFSMRSLLSKLGPSAPSGKFRFRSSSNGNGNGRSKEAPSLHTMSSVVISHCGDSASHTVVAAFDATKKLTFEAVDWGLLHMDLWPGDTLVVLGVITKIKSPLGMDVLADINGFSGVNPRVLEHEIAQRLLEYQKKLLARRLYCQKKGLNMEVRITAGHPLKSVVVREAGELQATWIILDRHLGGSTRYFLSKSACGLVLMNKKTNTGDFLRMSQQPSLTDPHYGGKYTSQQATTAPLSFADFHDLSPSASPSGSPGVTSPDLSSSPDHLYTAADLSFLNNNT